MLIFVYQTSVIYIVCSGHPLSPGRVPQRQRTACLLCYLCLHSGLRFWAYGMRPPPKPLPMSLEPESLLRIAVNCASLGDLWSPAALPRRQRRVSRLYHRLCCLQQLQYVDRLPIFSRLLWVLSIDYWRRDHCRYDRPGKERWCDGNLGLGSFDGSCHRASCRWLPCSSRGMAVGPLGHCHRSTFLPAAIPRTLLLT